MYSTPVRLHAPSSARRSFRPLAVAGALLAWLVAGSATSMLACPFCSAPTLTLSEQIHQTEYVVLAKIADSEPATTTSIGTTTFEVTEVLRPAAQTISTTSDGSTRPTGGKPVRKTATVEVGTRITLEKARRPVDGMQFVLFGATGVNPAALSSTAADAPPTPRARKSGDSAIAWTVGLEVSDNAAEYVRKVPAPTENSPERLAFFLDYLEHPDKTIANDAYGEFANAPYADLVPLADRLPREKLRQWLVEPGVDPSKLGLYGLMLGLCGQPEDAEFMESIVTSKSTDFRLGIDGVMGGYLLLTGEKGLEVLEQTKLVDKDAPFTETYSAMQSLRFLWVYARDRVPADRQRASMRLLLDRPELADMVVADLARMEDWSVQDQLMAMYGTGKFDTPTIKRAIVRYLMSSTREKPKAAPVGVEDPAAAIDPAAAKRTTNGAPATAPANPGSVAASAAGSTPAESPEQIAARIAKGKQYLAEIEQRDPKVIQDVKRYFPSR